MNLDWCPDENDEKLSKFNENSIISKEKIINIDNNNNNDEIINNINSKKINNVNLEKCFSINLKVHDRNNLLNILNYLSLVSNYLRTYIRNKSTKFSENLDINVNEYELINNYLKWLNLSCISIKSFFVNSLRKDNSYDPGINKLFKTSSYKFCNLKESCSIHKNKHSKCDKNHFVFDMIINDIEKLIESINIIGRDNFNWILLNNMIVVTFDSDNQKYNFDKLNGYIINKDLTENKTIIDKNLIYKSFDVVSYVLNKMFDEACCFLNNNNDSLIINLNF